MAESPQGLVTLPWEGTVLTAPPGDAISFPPFSPPLPGAPIQRASAADSDAQNSWLLREQVISPDEKGSHQGHPGTSLLKGLPTETIRHSGHTWTRARRPGLNSEYLNPLPPYIEAKQVPFSGPQFPHL